MAGTTPLAGEAREQYGERQPERACSHAAAGGHLNGKNRSPQHADDDDGEIGRRVVGAMMVLLAARGISATLR
jgi:hypothetical protein